MFKKLTVNARVIAKGHFCENMFILCVEGELPIWESRAQISDSPLDATWGPVGCLTDLQR